jgi:UDP-N-acetylmuramoylalanine--D-glutamate ligase
MRVTVMGLGRHGGGVAAARWLAEAGASVTLTDLADEAALADSLAKLADVPIAAVHLGGHRESDLIDAELIVVNPAVRPDDPYVSAARQSGVKITSEIELFLAACRGQVIGVTGSNGKSTTAAMIAAILSAAGRQTWLGGNIGRSLLPDLPRIAADDWVVLELSSFQLWWLSDAARWPRVAVVTNLTPNHLDWHGSFAHYAAAKQRLVERLPRDGVALLGDLAENSAAWRMIAGEHYRAAWSDSRVPELIVPGPHNRRNAALAATSCDAVGCAREAIEQGLREFRGLPHRLELVASVDGRAFYNDSMATTPESVLAALDALGPQTWFLIGGRDKGFDYGPLAHRLAREARGVACFGAAREKLAALISAHHGHCECQSFETLREALAWCRRRSRAGESIALSPACASHDQFRDYRERGEKFAELVVSGAW